VCPCASYHLTGHPLRGLAQDRWAEYDRAKSKEAAAARKLRAETAKLEQLNVSGDRSAWLAQKQTVDDLGVEVFGLRSKAMMYLRQAQGHENSPEEQTGTTE
jgi:hypothetical protein